MKPLVSVCIVTYNQFFYIEECIESIINQRTNFEFEVIIADDCSTDGTSEIVLEYAKRYPDQIIPLIQKTNIGPKLNYYAARDEARGEFVAHCDGDDFWLPGKLAYQAKILQDNPNYSFCWTCAHLVADDGTKIGHFPGRLASFIYPRIITARHIATCYAVVGQHSTQMYRRNRSAIIDRNQDTLDYWIAFNMALKGPAYYSKAIFSCYRLTKTPSITRTNNKKKFAVDVLSSHLLTIMTEFPDLASTAKSHLLVRRFLSKIRGHDTTEIDRVMNLSRNISAAPLALARSFIQTLAQKLCL